MNLCIDVGNTMVSVGLFDEDVLIARLSTATDTTKTEDEYASIIIQQMRARDIKCDIVEQVILSSVVPSLTRVLKSAIKMVFKKRPLLIGPGIKTGVSLKVDNPSEVGNDIIADLVGAKEKYGYPCLIADLGTASKIILLDKNGAFSSCLIVPGLSLSAITLSERAALLPEASLEIPRSVMGRNTIASMNAGIIFGHVDMINGLIKRHEEELGYTCKHILTGGGANYVESIIGDDFIYDEFLNLNGLNSILRRNLENEDEK